ncbi:unnamed protein product, partial [Effrenium voratum]
FFIQVSFTVANPSTPAPPTHRVLGIVAAADMPTGAAPAPPAPSPWWEGAGDSIGDAWNQFTSGDAAVGGAQQLLASCGLVAGAAWGFGWLKVKEIKLTCGL